MQSREGEPHCASQTARPPVVGRHRGIRSGKKANVKKMRVCIIGCGRIADLQVLGYLDHPRAELVAVCDRDAALARRRQAEWGARRASTDVDELLRDPDIDAVEILLPHHLHREVAIAALHAGKHVSLQKPPTPTLRELADVATRRRRRRPACCGCSRTSCTTRRT